MSTVRPERIRSFSVKTKVFAPKPIDAASPPQHPLMAAFGSNVHNDAYMSDVYGKYKVGAKTFEVSGPTGGSLLITQANLHGFPISLAFDSRGRIVTVVMNLVTGVRTLLVIDPSTLEVKAQQVITGHLGRDREEKIGGGVYFYLNEQNQAVIPTLIGQVQIWQISQDDEPAITSVKSYYLNAVIDETDNIVAALPDWAGKLWYVSAKGRVGFVDLTEPDSDVVNHTFPKLVDPETNEPEVIANAFAMDNDGGVFIVSDHALYRFEARDEKPFRNWRVKYERGTGKDPKPGQKSVGSGTTPTLIDVGTNKYVAIADNADHMNVQVFRRGPEEMTEEERTVCTAPVFAPGAGCTENSLICIGNSIVVENNYGYDSAASTTGTNTTTPGIARIDFEGKDSTQVWMNDLSVPSVVSKLCLKTGLVYTYAKKKIGWHFAAIDFETGKLAFEAFTGLTTRVNDHYAGLCLGPDGTAYIGVVEGIVAVRQQPADS